MYMSPQQEDWQHQGDPKDLRKPRRHTLQVVLSTILFVCAACAIYIAFWCPATQSLKFFGRCTTFEESVVVPNATSTGTQTSDRDNDNDDDYDSASSSFEVGSDLVIPDGEEGNENDRGGDGDGGSGPRTTIVNNIYQTDTTVVESETSPEDADFVTLTFIRKQVDRIYDYFNDRFEDIAQEFTTQVLNVTENINIDGSFTDNSNSVGDLGDVLVSTETGVVWMATSSLGISDSVGGAGPAGDSGEIQFNDDGDFGASSAFFWDNQNKALGIGTDEPSATLTVIGGSDVSYSGPGSELITNGSFDSDASDWNLNDCAAWNAGGVTVTYTACADPFITTEFTTENGGVYQIEFTLSGISGDQVEVGLDYSSYGNELYDADGTYAIEFTSDYDGAETLYFSIWDYLDGGTFTVDDVSVHRIGTAVPAATVLVENSIGERMFYLGEDGFDTVSIGREAGVNSTDATGSNFLGAFAGFQVSGSSNLNFIGNGAGRDAQDVSSAVFVGDNAGNSANQMGSSVLVGNNAGYEADGYANSIFIGASAGYQDILTSFPCGECDPGSAILIGSFTSTGGFSDSIAVGANTTNTASNQFMVGNINEVVLGDESGGPLLFVNETGIGLGTTEPTSALTIDLENDGAVGFINTVGTPYDVYVVNTYAYIADGAAGLTVVDVTNAESPTVVDTYDTSGVAQGIYVAGAYAYVADGTSGLQIINISIPSSPALVGTYDTSGSSTDVHVSGKHAYVTDGADGVHIIDVSNPASPALVGSYDTTGYAHAVYVSGTYAYIADGAAGLQIIDISNSSSPNLLGTYDTDDVAVGVHVSGKNAYVADDISMTIVDISNPSSPSLVSTDNDTVYNARDVFVAGRYAFVSGYIIDISDPALPQELGLSGNADGVYASGKYLYLVNTDSSEFRIHPIEHVDTPALYAGIVATEALSVAGSVLTGGDVYIAGGLSVGRSGILSEGGISAQGTSTFLGGNIGIGTTTPSAQLTTTGTVRFAALGSAGANLITDSLGNVTASSDERLKDLHDPFTRSISDLVKIKPITYTWKPETGYDTATVYTGFSAQNVQGAIPEAVATDTRGYLTLAERPILATVVNAIKEMWEMLTGQQERINELENRIRALESEQGIYHETESEGTTPIEIVPEGIVPEPGDTDPELPLGEVEPETSEAQNPVEVPPQDTGAPLPVEEPAPSV